MPAKKTPAKKTAVKPAAKATAKPTAKPAAKPTVKVAAKPVAAKPVAAKSAAVKATPAKAPAAVKHQAAKSGAAKPTATKPTATKPGADKPRAPSPPPVKAPPTVAAPKTAPKPAGKPDGITAQGIRVNPRPIAPPPTDGEDGDDGSLLAGPRNVQPYLIRRGEEYMNREQLEHFQLILNAWKRDLMEEVDRTVSHMKDEAANFPDPNDRATQEEEFSLELRTRDRERKLIRKIDEALKRIEDGNYGYCLETGEEIGVKRLEARPVATLSLEAQERRERREKQYGDRDDRYR
jgi:DnaK suppressor protein